jgi:hypothetical protein
MRTLRTAIIFAALAVSTSAFAMNTINPRAGSGGGLGRADLRIAPNEATGATVKPAAVQGKSMVRSGAGGSNTLGGRVVARPFTPTPGKALTSAD